jgi:hypothetical protein
MTKLLCGIMYCGEPQFFNCVQSLINQAGIEVTYFVLKDLPNKEAHEKLYQKFAEDKEHDFHLKLDADMVLASTHIIHKTLSKLEQYPLKTHFICGVLDFFTGHTIYGIHFFKRGHLFRSTDHQLFVDRIETERTLSLVKKTDYVATHAFSPSASQSFHYGLHKATKAFQTNCLNFDAGAACSHLAKIRSMSKQFILTQSYMMFMSILGAYRVYSRDIDERAINYDYYRSQEIFEKFSFIRDPKELIGFCLFLSKVIFFKPEKFSKSFGHE